MSANIHGATLYLFSEKVQYVSFTQRTLIKVRELKIIITLP